jgi:type I restriction enzyme S subunit
MSWENIQLGEFLTLKRGYDLSSAHRRDGEVPIVSSSGITGYHNEVKVAGPGVVTGRYGTLGEVFFVKEDFWPLNTALYVQDFKGNDPRFTAYFLKCVLKGTSSDKAAVPGVNRNDLHARKVTVTRNKSEQIAIAFILSAYDDLIENNRRRIQLLEQAARLLYQEWFVHLRFPGHEHVPITDGVPEGWEKKSLSEAADSVSYGLTASSTQDAVGPKFLRITDIVPSVLDWDEVPFCEAHDKEIERNRLEVGDVVVARTGATVGYAKVISRLPSVAVYASYLVRFRFGDPSISLMAGIFMESAAYKEYVKNHAGGAAQPNANATVLGSALMLIPPGVLQQQFSDSVTPIVSQRDTLVEQNGYLTKARDILLPRLMNGEVSV